MQTRRIIVAMNEAELSALVSMAAADCRPVREQVRWLVQQAARERRLLPYGDQMQTEIDTERGEQADDRFE